MIRNALARTLGRGRWAEALAERHLLARDMHLLARNYRFRGGEIDLIMEHAGVIVFVEVRYRGNAAFGTAAESVDRHKQQRLLRTAELYLQTHARERADAACRFDVIAITGNGQTADIEWIRDAFQA